MFSYTNEEKRFFLVQLMDSYEFLAWKALINPSNENFYNEMISCENQIYNLKNSLAHNS